MIPQRWPAPGRGGRCATILAASFVLWLTTSGAPASAQPASQDISRGRQLFENSCANCHGPGGTGTSLGPSLTGSGAAAADFMLTTGRMPMDDPQQQAIRKPPAFNDEQIRLITAYVSSLGPGPPIPNVDVRSGNLVQGQQLYSVNCAACHSSAGAGGAVGAGLEAPPLRQATPKQLVEAMRIGPGAMPVFGPDVLSNSEANSIARYLATLRRLPDRGGLGLGRIGPIAEGFVAWLLGMGVLLLVSRWIGEK